MCRVYVLACLCPNALDIDHTAKSSIKISTFGQRSKSAWLTGAICEINAQGHATETG